MKEETFKVFGSEILGRMFLPDGFSYEKTKALLVSPVHGRAVAIRRGEYDWLSVKGGGWTYGGPQVYHSKKDEELIFGLYPRCSAERESAVSREIEKFSDEFPHVLYYKRICDNAIPEKYAFLSDVTFKNGSLVDPCLIYTQLKSPFRIADLMYLTEKEREHVILESCRYWQISRTDFTRKFTQELAKHVAVLHRHGFINDTLDYGNVTLLSEIVDYEWVTVPGIKHLDGSFGLELSEERREKEILYGAEVCLQLKALLHEEYNLFDIYAQFVHAYAEVNPQFVETSERVRKILKREEFVL